MDIRIAKAIVNVQDKNVRKINNLRFYRDGYEYRLTYRGGFAMYVGIDRREVGKRNFKFFGGFGASDCWNVEQAIKKAEQEIEGRTK